MVIFLNAFLFSLNTSAVNKRLSQQDYVTIAYCLGYSAQTLTFNFLNYNITG